ncbi:hypothetical protein EJ03DRAFT_329533 [Teratosphaeria nubilosa]|uniref:Uncharacterized protein n=1 Tax=Teratosphaeria nubilosa TaxID=161662 RepID=A0A6G1L422_9PEZI|nr:hypothetical protein EJ03DRAFT_329533 [Teratosphaeria nubilosa]
MSEERCYLLEIPAELRNAIYLQSFTSDDDPHATDLLAINPPNAELLATCRKIFDEAAQMYKEIRDNYWSRTYFTIKGNRNALLFPSGRRVDSRRPDSELPSDAVLAKICNLELFIDGLDTRYSNQITLRDGFWTTSPTPRDPQTSFVVVAESIRPQHMTEWRRLPGRMLKMGAGLTTFWAVELRDVERLSIEQVGVAKEVAVRGTLTSREVFSVMRWLADVWL